MKVRKSAISRSKIPFKLKVSAILSKFKISNQNFKATSDAVLNSKREVRANFTLKVRSAI